MYLELQKRLGDRLRAVLQEKYNLQLENIPLEIPPDLQFGELSTPISFELARKLRKAPKVIAQEIVAAIGPLVVLRLLKLLVRDISMPGWTAPPECARWLRASVWRQD